MDKAQLRVAVVSASSARRDEMGARLKDASGIQISAAAPDLESLEQLLTTEIDVVLYDAPDSDAVELLISADAPGLPSVIMAGDLPRETVARALNSGSIALLERDAAASQLHAAIHAAAAGLAALSQPHAANLADARDQIIASRGARWVEQLTPRELEILRMLADGLPNKAIASQLQISEHTAKFHVGQILAKLDVQSRTEAVTFGIRHGLIMI